MKEIYVFDANAIIAYIEDENGADFIENLFNKATSDDITLFIHKLNLIEILYHTYRKSDRFKAMKVYEDIKSFPIYLISDISDNILLEACRLKANYKLSLADSIGLATSIVYNGHFVTSDHHELEIIQKFENTNIVWFR